MVKLHGLQKKMKCHQLLLVLFLGFLICDTLAEKPRKTKKFRRIGKPALLVDQLETSENGDDDIYKMMENDDAFDAKHKSINIPAEEITDNRVSMLDACAKVHCSAGRVCEVDENEEPRCVCISACPVETEPRRKVCSNHNETWSSDCAVYQQRCWCKEKDARCKGENFKHVHIEYYGECREMPECSEGEMADFPRRMRDWLFNIMRDLADRQELPAYYLKMEREAETNMTRRWSNAAIWKWCDLDGHPYDRSISRHELFPIRAPLLALEHCIAPFLDGCDADNNHLITFSEWAKCLEIEEDDIEAKCAEIEEDTA